ncbi:MAG: hypothetical protein Q8N51_10910 [Gammaproteobacteria bacterium]|nr:hypothetical protein [Gammaproteobacteria bacterium]
MKRVLFIVLATVVSCYAVVTLLFFGFSFRGLPDNPPTELANGYFYNDPGDPRSLFKYISSANAEDRGVVVSPTVDEYKVVGSKIFVTRRNIARVDAQPKGLAAQQIPTCEYWVIDTIAHTTVRTKKTDRSKKTEEWGGLTCYGLVRHE